MQMYEYDFISCWSCLKKFLQCFRNVSLGMVHGTSQWLNFSLKHLLVLYGNLQNHLNVYFKILITWKIKHQWTLKKATSIVILGTGWHSGNCTEWGWLSWWEVGVCSLHNLNSFVYSLLCLGNIFEVFRPLSSSPLANPPCFVRLLLY